MNGTDEQETMCDACYGYIHDVLISPLPKESIFFKHIHKKSIERAAPSLAKVLHRAYASFKQGELFFALPSRMEHKDPFIQSQFHDEFIWKQFLFFYPKHTADLNHTIELLIDYSVIRKTAAHHQLAEIYIKAQFHAILKNIKAIHHEHSNRIAPPNAPRLGPVPAWKLAMLKAKSGGGNWIDHFKVSVSAIPPPPPSNPNEKLTIRAPVVIDDDPLYW